VLADGSDPAVPGADDPVGIMGEPGAVAAEGVESLKETFLARGFGIRRSTRPSRGILMYWPDAPKAAKPF
jgi:hypothetical protein